MTETKKIKNMSARFFYLFILEKNLEDNQMNSKGRKDLSNQTFTEGGLRLCESRTFSTKCSLTS